MVLSDCFVSLEANGYKLSALLIQEERYEQKVASLESDALFATQKV